MEEKRLSGRPRSEEARDAVLRAVDDLLVDVGYSAMTMKGIAERAGVGRATVYRWWSTKAEVLLEATVADAREELAVAPTGSAERDVTAYLAALVRFLSKSDAGAGYRALLGEAQHDAAVASLVAAHDVLGDTARDVIRAAVGPLSSAELEQAAAQLVGPTLFWILTGRNPRRLSPARMAAAFLSAQRS